MHIRCFLIVANNIRNKVLEGQIGKTLSVLVEEKQKDNVYFGYTANYTPVKLKVSVVGEIKQVKITSVEDDFCIGEYVTSEQGKISKNTTSKEQTIMEILINALK